MNGMYFLKDARLWLFAFGGSMALGVMGFLVLPELMSYLETHVNQQRFLRTLFFLGFFVISLAVLGELTFRAGKLSKLGIYHKRGEYYRRILSFCLVALAIYLAVGLLSGGLSVLIHQTFSQQTFQEKKLLIDLILSQLPILVMPVLMMQFLAFSFFNARFFKTITLGFAALRHTYFKLLLTILGLFLLGLGFSALIGQIQPLWVERMALILVYGALGALAAFFIYSIGTRNFQTMKRREESCWK